MPEVINVRFRNRGKVYFFDPAGSDPKPGEQVVVETAKGLELGDCVMSVHEVEESSIVAPLRPVIRVATEDDIKVAEDNREKEKAAFTICQEKIANHGLDMKLVDVEYSFEGGKILFFFTSDGRVDFRELVKDLASVFRTRIELRQIGVRDGAKMLGGLGICGRSLCCTAFLDDFQPVSIKMAKTQSLSLNPTKISGVCGRLMCCLKYEQDAYEYLVKTVPKVDMTVNTPQGKGNVTEVNLLRRTVKVKIENSDSPPQSYHVDRLGYFIGSEYKEPIPEEPSPQPEPISEEVSDNRSNTNNNGGNNNGPKNDRQKQFKHKPDFRPDSRPDIKPEIKVIQPKVQAPQIPEFYEADDDADVSDILADEPQSKQPNMQYRKNKRGKRPPDKFKNKPPV